MCDHCGCRDEPAVDDLSREHETLLDLAYLLRRLASEGDHEAAVDLVGRELAPLLHRHTRKEELGLFTQLRASWAADSQVSELVGQHRSVEAQLEVIRAGADGWQDTAAALVADLDAHVLEEEVDLFPYAVYLLDEVQWGAVADVHEQVRGEPDDARGHRLAVWA